MVLNAVAKCESTSSIPILARIDVAHAKSADPKAYKIHISFTSNPFLVNQ